MKKKTLKLLRQQHAPCARTGQNVGFGLLKSYLTFGYLSCSGQGWEFAHRFSERIAIFFIFFYWAFSIHLITILRTGSGLELSPLRAACCQALLLHWRTLTSSCDSPQLKHSAEAEIYTSHCGRCLYSSNHPTVVASR